MVIARHIFQPRETERCQQGVLLRLGRLDNRLTHMEAQAAQLESHIRESRARAPVSGPG